MPKHLTTAALYGKIGAIIGAPSMPVASPPGVRYGRDVDPHERAISVWYRMAGLLRRKEIAIDIIEAEIRSAQQEAFREAAKLVLTSDPIEIARKLHERAEQTIRPM